MHPLPSALTLDAHYAVSGDVTIDPSAAIAPGSLLLAEPGCVLAIGAGVCVGAGSVLHAFGGNLSVGSGAILGAAVLLVGSGSIGEYACVGAMSTLIDATVRPRAGIPQESYVFGEHMLNNEAGLAVAGDGAAGNRNGNMNGNIDGSVDGSTIDGSIQGERSPHPSPTVSQPNQVSGRSAAPAAATAPIGGLPFQPAAGKRVYGLEAYYRLMAMLFPHRDFTMVATASPPTNDDPAHSLAPQAGKDGQAW